MTELREDIRSIELPKRMSKLPVHRGYPVPWFVAYIDGVPDFRIVKPGGVQIALQERRCWVCGKQILGNVSAYLVGPMCAVNRTSAEPPSHRDCAEYSAKACPFMSRPHARRRDFGKPEGLAEVPGVMIERNPGVGLVWVTDKAPEPFLDQSGVGLLFHLPDPFATDWYAHGREATREEVLASIESGRPALQEVADEHGETAALQEAVDEALKLIPA